MPILMIQNLTRSLIEPLRVEKCDTFSTRLRGFMFRNEVDKHYGLLFYQSKPSRMDSAIHMFFVGFDLAIIWLDENFRVVDKTLAKRWRPFYAPCAPALYILETHPRRLSEFEIGDLLKLEQG